MVSRCRAQIQSRWRRMLAAALTAFLVCFALGCTAPEGYKPSIDDRALANAADGDCNKSPDLYDGTEAWKDCMYALKHGDERPKNFSKSCSRPDPAHPKDHSKCVTPRTEYMVNQAKKQGHSPSGCNEDRPENTTSQHPLGRACDFMMSSGGKATGSKKEEGDRFAAWAVSHADELGILYVIWYHHIWVSPHWERQAYSPHRGTSGPGPEHTNHVHISMKS